MSIKDWSTARLEAFIKDNAASNSIGYQVLGEIYGTDKRGGTTTEPDYSDEQIEVTLPCDGRLIAYVSADMTCFENAAWLGGQIWAPSPQTEITAPRAALRQATPGSYVHSFHMGTSSPSRVWRVEDGLFYSKGRTFTFGFLGPETGYQISSKLSPIDEFGTRWNTPVLPWNYARTENRVLRLLFLPLE